MIIAHLPAGYILNEKLQARYNCNKYTWVGLLASILPDFDVISFYINNYEIPHHDYWPHYLLIFSIVSKPSRLGLSLEQTVLEAHSSVSVHHQTSLNKSVSVRMIHQPG